MFFIEDNSFLKQEHKEFITGEILSKQSNFPWYIQPFSLPGDGIEILTHTVLHRLEVRETQPDKYKFNSDWSDIFLDILKTFCIKHNIQLNELLRCALNLSFNTNAPKCDIHFDHEFPHNQLLIYINDPIDKSAKTVILDDDHKTVLKEIEPEQFKGICFEKKPHYLHYPKKGMRIVCVYTFR